MNYLIFFLKKQKMVSGHTWQRASSPISIGFKIACLWITLIFGLPLSLGVSWNQTKFNCQSLISFAKRHSAIHKSDGRLEFGSGTFFLRLQVSDMLFIFNISNVVAFKNISTFPKCWPGPPSNIWQVVVCCLSHLAMLAAWRICNKGNNGRIIIRNIKELTQQCTELSITQSRIALFLGRIKNSLPRVKTLNTFLLV